MVIISMILNTSRIAGKFCVLLHYANNYLIVFILYSIFQHMIRYRYLPFTHSKPKYQGHDASGKVIRAK